MPRQRLVIDLRHERSTAMTSRSARPLTVELLASRLPCVALYVAGAPLAANLKVDLGLRRLGILDDGDSHHLEMV